MAEISAYCLRCRVKRPMIHATESIMKNGRPITKATCSVCGATICRIGSLQDQVKKSE